MIERVIGALNLEFDLNDTEIADILWLAVQMRRSSGSSSPSQSNQRTQALTSEIDKTSPQLRLNQNKSSQKPSTINESSANVYPQSSPDSTLTSSNLTIKVPAARSLPNQLAIARSLRPLKRRVPSRSEFVFDEAATVHRIAEEKLWLPVMRPASERWLELALVIDEGTSMIFWQQTIKEFKTILETHGAFRDVRTWGLFTSENGTVYLRPKTGSVSTKKRLHNPKELIDPNGRRLFLIISDCISPVWHDGNFNKTLAVWACSSSMTIIQVLPEWLWERSALSLAESILLRSVAPGTSNQQLIMTVLDFLDESDVTKKLKVPVVTLEPESLNNWAQMIAGAADVRTKGFLFPLDGESFDVSSELTKNSSVQLSAEQRLQRFILATSPMGRKLAGLLAAAPVSLPVVRLIQQTMLRESSQVHVAEVFLGGILRPLSPINEDTEADNIQFDFVDGVRDLLIKAIPSTETTEVLNKVSHYIAQRLGLSVNDFTASLVNPGSDVKDSSGTLIRPFAQIAAKVLKQLGGGYAEFAERIEKNFDGGMQAIQNDNIQNINVNHYHHPLEPFIPVKHIPYTGAKHFVGRINELATIHEKLHSSNTLVIAGMGGVGKTELAIKYAQKHENDYPGGICWFSIRGSDIAAEIITFAKNYLKLEVPQKDFQEQPLTLKQQVHWCWLNWHPLEGLVLVVFDDVTSIDNIAEYLPTNNRFRVLITTRLRHLSTVIEEISLDVLSPEEALQLLRLIGESRVNRELEIAKEVCEWLGFLPSGIELVGRYIAKRPPHFTLARMLKQLKEERLQQEAINPKQKTLSTAQLGVKAAFNLSWLELDGQTQKVAALLSLFAADIFAVNWVKSITNSLNWNDNDVDKAFEQLYQHNLVNFLEESDKFYYNIHPLIREFLLENLANLSEVNLLKQAFADTFIEIAKSIYESSSVEFNNSVKNAIPHIAVVVENLIDVVSDENLIWPFVGLIRFYDQQNSYGIAEQWCQQCISIVRSRLGENHLYYAQSLNNLAQLYYFQGKYDEAEPMYKQVLKLYKRILGEDYPDYAQSLNNLAQLYDFQRKYDEAELLFKQVLELRKRILGENHPDYALSLNNLAGLYDSQGKYDEAELLYKQALELRKRILEENHPDYAASLSSLASLYDSQGKYDEAEPMYKQALELIKRILGENHPDYAGSLNNLALLYKNQGKYDESEPLYKQTLELTKRILGENHPNYATSLNNLASLYKNQGKYDEAEPLYKQTLELYKRILGENHPDYATSLSSLASLYKNQGKYDEAEPLYKQALELYKRILGENHPNYALSLNNLALLYKNQEKYDEAEPLLQQALELTKRILGENHPHYATSLNNLASLYDSQGKYDEAEALYKQTLELYKRILGENHPEYAGSLNNLASLYKNQGKYDEAEPLYKQALELTKHILGENHPHYALSLNNLALLYKNQGKYDEAEPMYKQALKITELSLGANHPNTITIRESLELLQNNL